MSTSGKCGICGLVLCGQSNPHVRLHLNNFVVYLEEVFDLRFVRSSGEFNMHALCMRWRWGPGCGTAGEEGGRGEENWIVGSPTPRTFRDTYTYLNRHE